MIEEKEPEIKIYSYEDDLPNEILGGLIPRSVRKQKPKSPIFLIARRAATTIVVPVAGILALAFVAVSGYDLVAKSNLASAPTVLVENSSGEDVSLSFGPHDAFSQPTFFDETRESFITQAVTFIEVDLDDKTVRYFDKGVLSFSAPILATGVNGSWWDAPSGIYQVENEEARHYSTYNQVYLPSAITFAGNYQIHGWPEYPNGTKVKDDFTGGGIRLDNDKALQLVELTEDKTIVLVHKRPSDNDPFVYKPVAEEVTASQYLVADLENGAVLAASDLHKKLPIASITKLMTAIVTAEELSLDSRVYITAPTFVSSLIPRLQYGSSVSMYSLLQLLLVESSNEAAEVIAGHYGREEFIKKMNEKAVLIGMFDTTFADPSGLSADNISSLADLYQLSRYIHENKSFIFEITRTGEANGITGGGEFSDLKNFNEVEGLNNFGGGKIGETMAAGQTSLSLHDIEIQGTTRTVVVILLNSEARDDDVKSLLNLLKERYKE